MGIISGEGETEAQSALGAKGTQWLASELPDLAELWVPVSFSLPPPAEDAAKAFSLRGRQRGGPRGRGAGNEVSRLDGPGCGCEGIWTAAVWKVGASGLATPRPNQPSTRPPSPLSRPLLLPSLQPTLQPGQMVHIKPLPCGSSTLPTRLPSPSSHIAQPRLREQLPCPVPPGLDCIRWDPCVMSPHPQLLPWSLQLPSSPDPEVK